MPRGSPRPWKICRVCKFRVAKWRLRKGASEMDVCEKDAVGMESWSRTELPQPPPVEKVPLPKGDQGIPTGLE